MKKKLGIFLIPFIGISLSNSQEQPTKVTYPTSFNVSEPLEKLFIDENDPSLLDSKKSFKHSNDKKNRKAQEFIFKASDGVKYQNDEFSIQRSEGAKTLSAPLKNWEGQSGGCPPDPSGAASKNHYIQMINSTPIKIFNKNNGATVGTVKDLGSLWNPRVDDDGDPIVMYDKFADRWFLAQFGDPAQVYVAVSKTNDPTGAYYTYNFTVDSFPDYLKFSIWEDGYYMTSQGTSFVNVLERKAMLAGDPKARILTKGITVPFDGFWCPQTAFADGDLPPAGSPCPLVYFTDNSYGGSFKDAVLIKNLKTNWSATSPSLTISNTIEIPVASFDSSYDKYWEDVEQGFSSQRLDALGGTTMYRAQWRKWAGYNTLLLCWPVKMSDGVYSTKWVELREDQASKKWSLYQEGIYAPDGLSRWVGTLSMDDNGSIGFAYLVAGKKPTAVSPTLKYTGRLKTDPLGKMTFAEKTAAVGSGTPNCGNRIGDYSHTSLDPDGLTFWHTGPYSNNGELSTKIFSFKIDASLSNEIFETQIDYGVYQQDNNLIVNASKINTNKEIVIDLFDINGKLINGTKQVPENNNINVKFSTSNLSKGVYLVRIGNYDFQKVIKTIVK